MTVATQKLSLAEYLNDDDGTDTLYEWVAGEFVPLSLDPGKHGGISQVLAVKANGTAISAMGGEVRPKKGRKSHLRHSPLRMEACAVCDRIRIGEFICTDY